MFPQATLPVELIRPGPPLTPENVLLTFQMAEIKVEELKGLNRHHLEPAKGP